VDLEEDAMKPSARTKQTVREKIDLKEAERLRDLFRREIVRIKAARFGLSFDQKIELARQRRGVLNVLTQVDEKVSKAAQALKQTQQKVLSEANRLEADVGYLKVPMPAPGPVWPSPEKSPRVVTMTFNVGVGTGASPVFQTENGKVGWMGNVEQFVNDDTGQVKCANFMLLWYAVIPRAGYYQLNSQAKDFLVDLDYKLTGNGLWGEDASLEVLIGSGLHIYNPVEYITVSTLEVDESKSTSGSTKGRLARWYSLSDVNSTFHAERDNTGVTFSIMMDIETWAEDGKVRVDVNDFWLPSLDANSDFSIVD
jgi:hypothetical protein